MSFRRYLAAASTKILGGRTTGPKMKGKRKIKHAKWLMMIQLQVESRRTCAKRSKNAANTFLDSVSPFVMESEPCGRLAGRACRTATEAAMNQYLRSQVPTPMPN